MGDYYQQQNQQKLSRSHYEKAIRYSPQLRKAHLALAQLFEQAGQNKDAITAYERVLSLDAQKPEAYDALIRLYRKTGKLDKLCDRWKARYRGNTDNETLKEFLIEALHKAERYEEARKLINEE
jgi:lipopolysaccharide biosynthesis regulator YciM